MRCPLGAGGTPRFTSLSGRMRRQARKGRAKPAQNCPNHRPNPRLLSEYFPSCRFDFCRFRSGRIFVASFTPAVIADCDDYRSRIVIIIEKSTAKTYNILFVYFVPQGIKWVSASRSAYVRPRQGVGILIGSLVPAGLDRRMETGNSPLQQKNPPIRASRPCANRSDANRSIGTGTTCLRTCQDRMRLPS